MTQIESKALHFDLVSRVALMPWTSRLLMSQIGHFYVILCVQNSLFTINE